MLQLTIIFLSSFLFFSQVRAELVIEITQGVDSPIQTAVVPFRIKSDRAVVLDVDISKLIQANLERSGYFIGTERSVMLSLPSPEDKIFYRDWRAIDSEYLVIGSIEIKGNNEIQVDFELHDVFGERQVTKFMYKPVPMQGIRDIGHAISDQIFEKLTGIRGNFQTKLLYVTVERRSEKDQFFQLMMCDSDGGRAQEVFRNTDPILSPKWSPVDSSRFAFMSYDGKQAVIYVQSLLTGDRKKIAAFPGLNSSPAWSPDGRNLALTLSKDGNPEIYIANLRTGEIERMTKHFAIDTEPTWAPDNKSIVFTSNRGGKAQLYQLDLSTKEVKRLTFEGDYNSNATFPPRDSSNIVFVHKKDKTDDTFHIAKMNLDSGVISTLTETSSDEYPSVSPNKNVVIYATSDKGQGLLGLVSIDGKIRGRLKVQGMNVREPSWSDFMN